MKIRKKWAWITMLLIGVASVGIISCSEDRDNNVTPVDEEGVESAWLTGYMLETPDARVTYLNVGENIPSKVDVSAGIELGVNAQVYSYGKNPYTYDPNAKTLTKWTVDKSDLSLSVLGILSFADAGIQVNFAEDIGEPAFISDEEAYFTDLLEGLIIEWNPTDMTITEVIEVQAVGPDVPGTDMFVGERRKYISGDNIFIPLFIGSPNVCCDFVTVNGGGVNVGVFNTTTNTLEYRKDDRSLFSRADFIVDPITNDMYVQPNEFAPMAIKYFNTDEDVSQAYSVLKFNSDGTFDQNFQLNLRDIVPIEVYTYGVIAFDGKLAFNYVDSTSWTFPETFNDRWSYYETSGLIKTVAIDVNTKEVTTFDGLSAYDEGGWLVGTVDGVNYVEGYTSQGITYFLRQNSFNDFTEVSQVEGGGFTHVNQLW